MELKINRLLKEGKAPLEISKILIEELQKKSSRETRQATLSFLLNAGLYSQIIEIINDQLHNNKKLYWSFYLEALYGLKIKITKTNIEQIVFTAKLQKKEHQLIHSLIIQENYSNFQSLKNDVKISLLKKQEQQYKELLEKIDFFKSQRLIEEEKKAFDQLLFIAPKNINLKKQQANLDERWAKHLFSKKKNIDHVRHVTNKLQKQWRNQQREYFTPIFDSSLLFAKKQPELAFNLALMSYFMEFFEEALQCLQYAPKTPSRDWLVLELLLETNRFVDVLEFADTLEDEYENNADAIFAITLAKSKSFWGLNKKKIALELVQSIINVRPNYRSASSLLEQWTGVS